MARYLSCVETAALLRAELKGKFPGTKFSVRSDQYSGGASINVEYTDGPAESLVDPVCQSFAGATFDGMRDIKEYHESTLNGETVHFGADFVFVTRHHSRSFLEMCAQKLGEEIGETVLEFPIKTHADSDHAYVERNALPHELMVVFHRICSETSADGSRHEKRYAICNEPEPEDEPAPDPQPEPEPTDPQKGGGNLFEAIVSEMSSRCGTSREFMIGYLAAMANEWKRGRRVLPEDFWSGYRQAK